MTLPVLALVLLAALIHALWNTWLKVSGDRLAALAALAGGWALVGLASLPFTGAPSQESWPYLLISTAVHSVYSLTLIQAYRLTDLSTSYPIARGTGPLVVAAVSYLYLGDSLGLAGFTAVGLIVVGVVWLGAPRLGHSSAGLIISLLTGGLIGIYTLLDGLGARAAHSPHAFAASLFLLTALPIFAVAGAVHGTRLAALVRPVWRPGVLAGIFSAAAYWLVVWAMSVAPLALVAAVRESGVVFAALLGGRLLKERVRWIAILLVLAGTALSRLATG